MSGIKGAKEAAAYIREWRKTFAGGVKSVNKSEATSDSEDLLSMTNFEIALGRMVLACEFMAESISKGVSTFPNPRKWVRNYNESSKSQATNDEVQKQVESVEIVVNGAQDLVVRNPEIGEADKAQQTKAQIYFLAKMFSEIVKKLPSGVELKSKLPKMPEAPKLPNLSRDAINDRIGKWALTTALNLLAQMQRKSKLTDAPAQEAAPKQKSKGPASKARERVADAGAIAKAGLNTIAKHMKECADAVRQATPGPREAASAVGTGILTAAVDVALFCEYMGDMGVRGTMYNVKEWLRSHVGRSGNKSETSTSKAKDGQEEQSLALVVQGVKRVESEVTDPTQQAEARYILMLKVAKNLAKNTHKEIMSLMPQVELPPMPRIVIPKASFPNFDNMSSKIAADIASSITNANADLGISGRPTVPPRPSRDVLYKPAQRRVVAQSENNPLVPPRPDATKPAPKVPDNRPAPRGYEALIQNIKGDPKILQIVQGKLLNPLGTDNIIRSELLRIGAGFSEKEVDVMMGNMQQFREDMGVSVQERRERAYGLSGEELGGESVPEGRKRPDALAGEELGRGKESWKQWFAEALAVAKQRAPSSPFTGVVEALGSFVQKVSWTHSSASKKSVPVKPDVSGPMLTQYSGLQSNQAEQRQEVDYNQLLSNIQMVLKEVEGDKRQTKAVNDLEKQMKLLCEYLDAVETEKKKTDGQEVELIKGSFSQNIAVVGSQYFKEIGVPLIVKLMFEVTKQSNPELASALPPLLPVSQEKVKSPCKAPISDPI